MASNLPSDPCAGAIINTPFGRTSNLPVSEVCDSPPTCLLVDWNPVRDQFIVPNIREDTQCALLEWTGTSWNKISDFNPHSVSPYTTHTEVLSISRFGDQIWIGCGGFFARSQNGGQDWDAVLLPVPDDNTQQSTSISPWIDKDASGRLWVVTDAFPTSGIYRDDTGAGDSFEQVGALPAGGYLTDGTPWGPAHVISCHPTNPDVVIIAFNRAEDYSHRDVYVTTNGGDSWTTIILPNQFPSPEGIDDAAEGFFAAGDQGFNADGTFFITWEVERYKDPFVLGPDNRHYIWVAKTTDYSSFSAVDVSPFDAQHFGFMQQLYIYGDTLHVVWAQDFSGDPAEGFNSFEGLAAFISRSDDGGETWSDPLNFEIYWLQPINFVNDLPGYPQDLFYDNQSDTLWAFFNYFDDSSSAAVIDELQANVSDRLQWTISGSSKEKATDTFRSVSGLPYPRTYYHSMTRPWPPT